MNLMENRSVTLRGLEVFDELARTGSLHDTARRLGLSPPAASQQLKNLETALGESTPGRAGFVATVQSAARELDAEYLFELPASGLALNCERIAMLRMKADDREDIFLLVKLGTDGETITVAEPDEDTKGLTDFARAFVNVLTRL